MVCLYGELNVIYISNVRRTIFFCLSSVYDTAKRRMDRWVRSVEWHHSDVDSHGDGCLFNAVDPSEWSLPSFLLDTSSLLSVFRLSHFTRKKLLGKSSSSHFE